MPLYSYQCDKCQHVQDSVSRISDRDDPIACEKCGGSSPRFPEGELNGRTQYAGDMIRESRSLAVPVDQILSGEADRIHPGAEFGKPNKGGMCRMIINDRREKLKRIKERSKATGIDLCEW